MENLSDLNKQLYFCQNVLSKRIPLQLIEEDTSFYLFDEFVASDKGPNWNCLSFEFVTISFIGYG